MWEDFAGDETRTAGDIEEASGVFVEGKVIQDSLGDMIGEVQVGRVVGVDIGLLAWRTSDVSYQREWGRELLKVFFIGISNDGAVSVMVMGVVVVMVVVGVRVRHDRYDDDGGVKTAVRGVL